MLLSQVLSLCHHQEVADVDYYANAQCYGRCHHWLCGLGKDPRVRYRWQPNSIGRHFDLSTSTTAAETYGPHMGCIWATYGDLVCNIWSFFNIWGRKSFRKHNIWATYGSLFQTYGVLLKHVGPFWNIWDLSETYGAFLHVWKVFVSFSDLPHCIIPCELFFFLSKVLPITNQAVPDISAKEKTAIGSFRESLKPVFYHQSWKATSKNFKLILRLRFRLPLVCMHTSTTPQLWPGPCLVLWAPPRPLEERAHAEVHNVRRPQRLNQAGEPRWNLSFNFSWVQLQVQVSSLHACRIVTTIDRRWLWPRGRHGDVFFCRLSPWLKAIAKFFKGIWVSRLWSCLGLRRSAALVTDTTNVRRLLHHVSPVLLFWGDWKLVGVVLQYRRLEINAVTVLCMSLLREDRGVNSRGFFFCVKMILVSRVNASRQSAWEGLTLFTI